MAPTSSLIETGTRRDFRAWRPAVGALAILSGIAGLIVLTFVTVPPSNQQAVFIGIGVVLGWGSTVVQSEFGGSNVGRRLGEKVVDQMTVDGQQNGGTV